MDFPERERSRKSHLERLPSICERLPDGFVYHRLIFDSAGAPVDSVILDVNPAFESLSGFKRRDVAGRRMTEFLPEVGEKSFGWTDACKRAIFEGEAIRFEGFFKTFSRWCEVTMSSDQPDCLVTIFRDVTEEKMLRESLQFERTQLFSLFESIEEVIYISDPYTYEVLYTNRWTQKMFGKNLIGGLCYQEFQNRATPCPFCTNPIILQNKGQPYRWEYYNPVLRRHYFITDRIIRWSDGRDVRFEIAIDITAQKEVEADLRESEEKWRITLDSLGEGLISTNAEGRVVYMNPVAETLTGWTLGKRGVG